VEWSYRLLSESEQILFNRLSVFSGGCDVDAAEVVCAGAGLARDLILDSLSALIDKSLVVVGEDSRGRSRYMLLETLREYARQQLDKKGRASDTHMRHATYFLGVATETEPQLESPGQAGILMHLEDDHDNFRAALRWLVDAEEIELALKMAGALVRFWLMHGHLTEGRQWFAERIDGSPAGAAVRAKALRGQGILAWRQADYVEATASTKASLDIWRELGDKAGIADALHGLGSISREQGDTSSALEYFEEGLALASETDDRRAIARGLNNLGTVAADRGAYSTARSLFLESLAVKQAIGDRSQIALTTANLAEVLLEQADYKGARTRYEESLMIFRELGDQVRIAFCIEGFIALAAAQGQDERAMRLAGAAEAQRKIVGSMVPPAGRTKLESHLAPARRRLGPAAEAAAFNEGSEMGLDQAVAEALAVEVS